MDMWMIILNALSLKQFSNPDHGSRTSPVLEGILVRSVFKLIQTFTNRASVPTQLPFGFGLTTWPQRVNNLPHGLDLLGNKEISEKIRTMCID
jgi:hypothetical protein